MKYLFILSSLFLGIQVFGQKEDSLLVKNASLHYYTYGKGEPIVILSGGPGVASHQEDDLALELSKKHKVILFDQRGTGKSWTKPFDSTTINIKTAIDDIEKLRNHLKIKQLILSGHSWGAMLASAYTEKYPQNVKSLILIGGGEIDVSKTEIVNQNVNVRLQLSDTISWKYWSDSINIKREPIKAAYETRKLNWSLLSFDKSKLDAIVKQAMHGDYNSKMGTLMWLSLKREKFNVVSSLAKKYKGKTLIVFGWQDPIGLTTLTLYQKAFPNAKIEGINYCGHMPSVEQPEEFYKIVNDFLQ